MAEYAYDTPQDYIREHGYVLITYINGSQTAVQNHEWDALRSAWDIFTQYARDPSAIRQGQFTTSQPSQLYDALDVGNCDVVVNLAYILTMSRTSAKTVRQVQQRHEQSRAEQSGAFPWSTN